MHAHVSICTEKGVSIYMVYFLKVGDGQAENF